MKLITKEDCEVLDICPTFGKVDALPLSKKKLEKLALNYL